MPHGLQHECERQIASGMDIEDALEVISLAEDLHCERLRAHCLELLRSASAIASAPPSPMELLPMCKTLKDALLRKPFAIAAVPVSPIAFRAR